MENCENDVETNVSEDELSTKVLTFHLCVKRDLIQSHISGVRPVFTQHFVYVSVLLPFKFKGWITEPCPFLSKIRGSVMYFSALLATPVIQKFEKYRPFFVRWICEI